MTFGQYYALIVFGLVATAVGIVLLFQGKYKVAGIVLLILGWYLSYGDILN